MQKKILRLIYLVIVTALIFTGCNPMKKEDTTVDTWEETLTEWKSVSPQEIDEHIDVTVSDSYCIDADIMVSESLESYEIQNVYLTRHILDDVGTVLESWLAYCGIAEYSEIKHAECGKLLEEGKEMYMADAGFGEDNLSWAQVRSTYALMVTEFTENYGKWNLHSMFSRQNDGWMNLNKTKILENNEIIPQEKVLEIQENIASIFGVEFMDEYILYTYNLEQLKEIVDFTYKYEKDMGFITQKWDVTDADEGAVIVFQQGYQGIPFTFLQPSKNVTGATWSVDNYCLVTVSKDEIKGLEIMNLYNIEEEAESVKILSFGEFVEKHVQMREGVDTKVVNIGLYYLPIYTEEAFRFVTKPVWCVQTEKMKESGYTIREWDIYDAVTGEEMAW